MFRGWGESQVGSDDSCNAIKKGKVWFEQLSYLQRWPAAAGVFGSSSPQENQDPHPG